MSKKSENYRSIHGAVMPSEGKQWSDMVEQELAAKTLKDYSYPFLVMEDAPIYLSRYFDLSDDSRCAFLALSVRYGAGESLREVRCRDDSRYFLYEMTDLNELVVSIHSPDWYRHALPAEIYFMMSEAERSFFFDERRLFIKMMSRSYVSYQERIVPIGFSGFAEVNEFLCKQLPGVWTTSLGRTEGVRTVGQYVLSCLVSRFKKMHKAESWDPPMVDSEESVSRDASLRVLLLFLLILKRAYGSVRFGEYLVWLQDWIVEDRCDDCAVQRIFECAEWESAPWNIFPYAWNNADTISKYMKVDKQPTLFVAFRKHEESGSLTINEYAHQVIVRKWGIHSYIYHSRFSEELSLFVNSEMDTGLSGSTISARALQVIYFCIDAHVKAYKYVLRLRSKQGFTAFLKTRHVDVFLENNELRRFIVPDLLYLRKSGGPLGYLAESFAFLAVTNEVNADIYEVFERLRREEHDVPNIFSATLKAHLSYRPSGRIGEMFEGASLDTIFERFFNYELANDLLENAEHDVCFDWAYPPQIKIDIKDKLEYVKVIDKDEIEIMTEEVVAKYIKVTTVDDLLTNDSDWNDTCSYSKDESSSMQWIGLADARKTYEHGRKAPGECAHTPTCPNNEGCNLRLERKASGGRNTAPGHGGRYSPRRGGGRGSRGPFSSNSQRQGMRVYPNRF